MPGTVTISGPGDGLQAARGQISEGRESPSCTAQKRAPRELGLNPLRRGGDLGPIGTSERGCDSAGLGSVEAGTSYCCCYCLGTIVGVTLPGQQAHRKSGVPLPFSFPPVFDRVQQAEMKHVVCSLSPSITEYGERTGARS